MTLLSSLSLLGFMCKNPDYTLSSEGDWMSLRRLVKGIRKMNSNCSWKKNQQLPRAKSSPSPNHRLSVSVQGYCSPWLRGLGDAHLLGCILTTWRVYLGSNARKKEISSRLEDRDWSVQQGSHWGFSYMFISSSPTAVHGSQGCTQQGTLGLPRALHLVTWTASEETLFSPSAWWWVNSHLPLSLSLHWQVPESRGWARVRGRVEPAHPSSVLEAGGWQQDLHADMCASVPQSGFRGSTQKPSQGCPGCDSSQPKADV